MPGRVSVNQLMRANIMSYDCAGSDETTCAESDPANYGCVRAHGHAFFDPRFHRFPVRIAAPRRKIISQDGVWTEEYVVRYMHVLPHAHSVFDGYVVSDSDPALDESVISDVAVRADHSALQYMSKRPYARTFAYCICFDQRCVVNEWSFFQFTHRVINVSGRKRCTT